MVDMFYYLTTSKIPLPPFALTRGALILKSSRQEHQHISTLNLQKAAFLPLLHPSLSYNFSAFSDPPQSFIVMSAKGLCVLEEYLIPLFWCSPAFPPSLDYISLVFFPGLFLSLFGVGKKKKHKHKQDSLIPIHTSFY